MHNTHLLPVEKLLNFAKGNQRFKFEGFGNCEIGPLPKRKIILVIRQVMIKRQIDNSHKGKLKAYYMIVQRDKIAPRQYV